MAKGRSRIPFEHGRVSIHSLSAAAIDAVAIKDGERTLILIEITMNNSSGVYQVDELEGEAPRLRARAVRRGDGAYRHRSGKEPDPAHRLEL